MDAMSAHGHWWTIWPLLAGRLRAPRALASEPFTCRVHDPQVGDLEATGYLTPGDPRALLVMIPGLGGSAESLYLRRAALAASARGLSILRLNLRGADRRGGDFYHAGLTDDLHQVLASPSLAGFERIWVLGFSVGGHVVLKLGTEVQDPRVRAVAGICSPLDLDATVTDFDKPGFTHVYRRHVFNGLFEHYREVAKRRPPPTPIEQVLAAQTLRAIDSMIVVPRFGFDSAEHYYAEMSVGPRLDQLKVPALLVATEEDPMVSARSIRSGLARGGHHDLRVAWSDLGGHVGFPSAAKLDLAGGARASQVDQPVDAQVVDWLAAQ